jgi:hypothetical protein
MVDPTLEMSHRRMRVTAVRLSDVTNGRTADERSADRDATGRFVRGNRAGAERAEKRTLRDRVPLADRPVYDALLRALGCRGAVPFAAQQAAAAVRHDRVSADFLVAATAAGLATAEGLALAGEAREQAELALRFATAALAYAGVKKPDPEEVFTDPLGPTKAAP